IGTEHVLIAVLTTPGSAAGQALLDLGVLPDGVLAELSAASCQPRRSDGYRLMPRLKQALDHAQRIGTGREDQTADTAHLLAGILNVPDALAVRLLARQGVTVDVARAALARRLEIDPQQLVVSRSRRKRLLVRQ
ncbi:MAG: Clp protease N-terminal domain-containing protein, partial [Actinomycetes bacterium]